MMIFMYTMKFKTMTEWGATFPKKNMCIGYSSLGVKWRWKKL